MDRLSGYNLYRIIDTPSNPKCSIKHILVSYFPMEYMATRELKYLISHNPLNKYKVIGAFYGEDSQGIHSERGEENG